MFIYFFMRASCETRNRIAGERKAYLGNAMFCQQIIIIGDSLQESQQGGPQLVGVAVVAAMTAVVIEQSLAAQVHPTVVTST